MYLKEHIVRVENIKTLQTLDQANIDHKVIALFMSCEGIPMQTNEVTSILNTYDALGSKKIPSKKVQALIQAKQLGEEDDSLPCPV
ncbi:MULTISPECIES: hypothetical protein [Acinetobacter]|uniref:Uncharacterized protein n=3 Tax=Acinetobacter TaxID=469 RepID=V2U326_9GAMM|nr:MULTISPECIES: hypothetical protein [Acinetobacter]AVH13891.1 hypothetical protein CTZ23_06070 [Acinetobacter indicus]ENW89458.1 hypothetical protein F905_01241 [Acinetobacter sp. CIP 53.82]EPF72707.1 hypothetical protein F956_01376 [Acinetobacter indicus ANC 4215]ESK48413.1 hypothetical protein P253_01056 [Acinetobacter indicus CIP 110367]MBA0154442.1 hypothetical protein [Acinetobacter indicus]